MDISRTAWINPALGITELLADSLNQVENNFQPQIFLIFENYLQKMVNFKPNMMP